MPVNSEQWTNEKFNVIQAGGGNGAINSFLERYGLGEPGCDLVKKYNSVGCQYWRDKLFQIGNGLMPEGDLPSKVSGAA